MRPLITLLFLFFSVIVIAQNEHYLLAGTYNSAKSEGIYVYKFNSQTGEAKKVSEIKSSNPSFLTVSPNQNYVYAVNEDKPGNITAYSFNKTNGTLSQLNIQPSKGDHPCYITISKDGRFVITGNYSSGTVAVNPVKKDNSLDTAIQIIKHSGSSVNTNRQQSAHVHAAVFSASNKFLFVPDLGMDKLVIYNFNASTGKLTPAEQPFIKVAPGSGPRHFEFHPNNKFAYLMKELNGEVEVFRHKNGKLKSIQTISSHPLDYKGAIGSADIHVSPDGKFLYCSNRGESNTIAIFKINKVTGKLTALGHQPTLGFTPRNFNFDPGGNFLLVANQDSGLIVIFKRNKETGLLENTDNSIDVGKPVCIKWINE
jgi:6-phosphogluconolactonase